MFSYTVIYGNQQTEGRLEVKRLGFPSSSTYKALNFYASVLSVYKVRLLIPLSDVVVSCRSNEIIQHPLETKQV